MIKIHNKLWFVRGYNRTVEDSEHLLAYMTHAEYDKEGEELKNFSSRKNTGKDWAKPRGKYNRQTQQYEETPEYDLSGEVIDNNAVSGFRVVGSVSRWSTDNKLIRIEDPRGFVVEIPTGNLTTLLKHTTVVKGEIMEERVWGKEGNNHILLPVSSEEYKQARTNTNLLSEMIPFSRLEIGDVVKFSVESNRSYVYLGKKKAIWEQSIKQAVAQEGNRHWRPYKINDSDEVILSETITDTKWNFVFYDFDKKDGEYKLSGKCIKVGSTCDYNKDVTFGVYVPDRIDTSYWYGFDYGGKYLTSRVVSFIDKEK